MRRAGCDFYLRVKLPPSGLTAGQSPEEVRAAARAAAEGPADEAASRSAPKLFFTSPEVLVAGAPGVLYFNRARSALRTNPNVKVGCGAVQGALVRAGRRSWRQCDAPYTCGVAGAGAAAGRCPALQIMQAWTCAAPASLQSRCAALDLPSPTAPDRNHTHTAHSLPHSLALPACLPPSLPPHRCCRCAWVSTTGIWTPQTWAWPPPSCGRATAWTGGPPSPSR